MSEKMPKWTIVEGQIRNADGHIVGLVCNPEECQSLLADANALTGIASPSEFVARSKAMQTALETISQMTLRELNCNSHAGDTVIGVDNLATAALALPGAPND